LLATHTSEDSNGAINTEEVNRLASQKKDAKPAKNQLKVVNNYLEAENCQLESKIDRLKTMNNLIEIERNQVETENFQLKRRNNQIKTERDQIEADHILLVEQNTILKSENQKLEIRLRGHQQLVAEKLSLEEIVKQLKMDLEAIEVSQKREKAMPLCLPEPICPLKPKVRNGREC